ncbi:MULTISPECIES: hypothetical protein [unclassified Modestobacter]
MLGLYRPDDGSSSEPFDRRRTGLDHLAFEVADEAELDARIPHLDELGVPHSPVRVLDLGRFWRNRVQKTWPDEGPLTNVSRTEVDLIEGVQPYRGVDLSKDPEGSARRPPAALTQVNNAYKRTAVAVACLAMTGSHHVSSVKPELPVNSCDARAPDALGAGHEDHPVRTSWPNPVRVPALFNRPSSVRFTDQLGLSVGSNELPDMWDAVLHVISP